MSQRKKATVKKAPAASLVWFDIPADKPDRAKKFYETLFGWKVGTFPGMESYWHIETGGADESPDGGLMPRMHPEHTFTAYISVASVTRHMARVVKLGGTICKPKTAVPGMGYFAICKDTENNTFAIWERNDKAK